MSGRLGPRRLRFDFPEPAAHGPSVAYAPPESLPAADADPRLAEAIERTREFLLSAQHADGYWVAELEGDTILESEFILLLAWLGRENSDLARRCAAYIRTKQLPHGGWALYPDGPLEISSSVKAYFALKLTGHSPDADYMVRAREAILAAGGAERVNSFTRYYLALLGVISYRKCPAVPPELMLIPRWMPFNIYEMSAWSRTILVPLSLLWAYQPRRELPEELGIRELFTRRPEDLPLETAAAPRDALRRRTWIDWEKFFGRVDRAIKFFERWRLRPLRALAIRKAEEWMLERFENSDGLGAIFPPIIWSVVALRCLGYSEDSPEVREALEQLEALAIPDEDDTTRLEPCKSPVWDTAITALALREAGVRPEHAALRRAARWLLSQEIRRGGDWAVRNRGSEPSGWCFEFNNEFYPDIDDTCMVLMALCRLLPEGVGRRFSADFLLGAWSPHEADRDVSAIVSSTGTSAAQASREIETAAPLLNAIWRGARWVLAMQGQDGGWGAFDRDNNRELFTRVPFADHNAMIDPSTSDLTARALEMFGMLGVSADHPAMLRAMEFVWNDQQPDACWYGRWGVNYIYGTWQALLGLTSIGVPSDDLRLGRAADWLVAKQQPCGGWGESPASYDDPSLRGQGPPTASQTAWALMGLMAAGRADSEAVRRGVEWLLERQLPDGTWDEASFTGTGFPRVFYLKYHFYRVYFPLMALGRYHRLRGR
ncbi:MAG: terpene cyclase/mutase family protein [Planctomycetes bacterium]|nr:terpene cyclase/mutase family protein [Planctomycetota bacterium]